ncbi:MAG: hypothetical protein ABEK02_05505 [Haloquadratum sp.]
MRRRTVLCAVSGVLGTLLAGCSTTPSGTASPADTTTSETSRRETESPTTRSTTEPTPTRTATATPATWVAPGESLPLTAGPFDELRVASIPSWVPFTGRCGMLDPAAATGVPRLRARLTNPTDTTHRLQYAAELPFPVLTAESDAGAALVASSLFDADRAADCPRTTPVSRPGTLGRTFAPGESVAGTYAIANHAGNEACFPSGTYAFRTRYAVGADATLLDESTENEFSWGFTLTVS